MGVGGREGRDGPRDKTSDHELSSRSRYFYSGREAPSLKVHHMTCYIQDGRCKTEMT